MKVSSLEFMIALLLVLACSIERAAAAAVSSAPTNYNHGNNNHDKRNQGNCNHDNCLRQAFNTKSTASITTFCVTYTQTVNQATAGLPAYVSQCSGSPSRISSMCSCVMSSSSLTSPTTLSTTTTTPSSTTAPSSTTLDFEYSTCVPPPAAGTGELFLPPGNAFPDLPQFTGFIDQMGSILTQLQVTDNTTNTIVTIIPNATENTFTISGAGSVFRIFVAGSDTKVVLVDQGFCASSARRDSSVSDTRSMKLKRDTLGNGEVSVTINVIDNCGDPVEGLAPLSQPASDTRLQFRCNLVDYQYGGFESITDYQGFRFAESAPGTYIAGCPYPSGADLSQSAACTDGVDLVGGICVIISPDGVDLDPEAICSPLNAVNVGAAEACAKCLKISQLFCMVFNDKIKIPPLNGVPGLKDTICRPPPSTAAAFAEAFDTSVSDFMRVAGADVEIPRNGQETPIDLGVYTVADPCGIPAECLTPYGCEAFGQHRNGILEDLYDSPSWQQCCVDCWTGENCAGFLYVSQQSKCRQIQNEDVKGLASSQCSNGIDTVDGATCTNPSSSSNNIAWGPCSGPIHVVTQ